jgi:hypothetical protein
MFDLVGKKLGVPAYRLLGGAYRDGIEVDYWTGRRTTADAIRKAKEACQTGFHGIKFKCNLQDDVVGWAQGIRQVCGPEFRIVLDPTLVSSGPQRLSASRGNLKREGISSTSKTLCRAGICSGTACFEKKRPYPLPCT